MHVKTIGVQLDKLLIKLNMERPPQKTTMNSLPAHSFNSFGILFDELLERWREVVFLAAPLKS